MTTPQQYQPVPPAGTVPAPMPVPHAPVQPAMPQVGLPQGAVPWTPPATPQAPQAASVPFRQMMQPDGTPQPAPMPPQNNMPAAQPRYPMQPDLHAAHIHNPQMQQPQSAPHQAPQQAPQGYAPEAQRYQAPDQTAGQQNQGQWSQGQMPQNQGMGQVMQGQMPRQAQNAYGQAPALPTPPPLQAAVQATPAKSKSLLAGLLKRKSNPAKKAKPAEALAAAPLVQVAETATGHPPRTVFLAGLVAGLALAFVGSTVMGKLSPAPAAQQVATAPALAITPAGDSDDSFVEAALAEEIPSPNAMSVEAVSQP